MPNLVLKANPSVYLLSADGGQYHEPDWLAPPSFDAFYGVIDPKYWKLNAGETDLEEMSQAEKDAVDALEDAATLANAKTAAKSDYEATRLPNGLVLRAIVKLLVDELNILRSRDRDRAQDVANATSLADLKTLWAANSSLGDRDYQQAKTAIEDAVDAEP